MVPLPTLAPSLDDFRAALAALPVDQQRNFMHGLPKREMRKLWEEGAAVLLEEMIGGEGEIVVQEGQNDLLPFFDRFEKHVVRREGGAQGINVQRFAWATGPGHFTLRQEGPEVWFDYTVVPASAPQGWPPVVSNEQGLSKLVYGHMIDRVRGVIPGMTVGKVFRHGKPEEHYFMLSRR
ncbi:MAG: hypothetical protein FJ102_04445 [Deltaproteobacteria bacterium]|nr:hypothetical protein [Deltaproteobacteria bacterium]